VLISAPELAELLESDRPLTLLDVRWRLSGPSGRADYEAGHIPGAVFVDLDHDLAGQPTGGARHPMPDAAAFGEAMRRCGVRSGTPVVCYDERDGASAARGWWLLAYFGHPAVRVLDGGLAAWHRAGGDTTAQEPDPVTGDFQPIPGNLPVLDADGAAELASGAVLLDARAAGRYRGDEEPVDPIAGHIPGARSAPTLENLDSVGRFRPPAELRDRFRTLGVTGNARVGVYCGSGVTAAHEVLALKLAGIEAGLYVGSWSDWISDPRRPVAVGPERDRG
jgi:thiosulfate/3-mercaptopyruvate sulfurtransferase